MKFNWARLQDPNNHANRAAQANLIAQMNVVDPLTLQIVLKAKDAEFPVAVALIPFIGSPAAIQSEGANFTNAPVGAGPFTLKSWTRDSQMVFVRNPNYWNAPQPYLDSVIIKPIIDETQRINTFTTGEANLVFVGAPQNADLVNKSKTGTEYPMILNGGINIYWNTKTAPFNDVRARQAIAMAIDFNDYSKVVDSGLVEPIDSVFRHDSPFYDPTILQPAYNPTQAQALINQVAAENGGTFTFTMTAFSSQNYAVAAQYIQGALAKYQNIKMNIVTEASSQHITTCTAGSFAQACEFGNIFDDPEPTWTGLYTCTAVPSPTGWCDSKFDQDVLDNQATLNGQQRIADIKDAQKEFYAQEPSLYVERRYSWDFAAPNIQDFKYADDGMPLLSLMWIKTHG